MRQLQIGGVSVDFSDGCGGVFFDRFELRAFEVGVPAGETLADLMASHHDLLLDYSARINCPNDPSVTMMRRCYSPKRGIHIDECPKCGGIWLDGEELQAARYETPNEEERNRLTVEFVDEVMASAEVTSHELAETNSLWKLKELRKKLTIAAYYMFLS